MGFQEDEEMQPEEPHVESHESEEAPAEESKRESVEEAFVPDMYVKLWV